MAVVKRSVEMPDGRTLEVIPDADGMTYHLDGKPVSEADATKAWNEQAQEWQRGRTLAQTLDAWFGGGRSRG